MIEYIIEFVTTYNKIITAYLLLIFPQFTFNSLH